jgi:hypothetical protein
MNFTADELIDDLTKLVKDHITFSKNLLDTPNDHLQFRKNEKSWSVLECLEHLNLYGNFYIPEITERLKSSKKKSQNKFISGFWGNKFALDMLPKKKMKTMNTFKSKNPIHSNLDKEKVILSFISQQEKILELLEASKYKNLTKIKTSLTIPFLKFKLGDTFRFVIFHNERHIKQALSILENFSY